MSKLNFCRFYLCAALYTMLVGMAAAQGFPLTVDFLPAPVAGQPFRVRVTTTPCDSIQENVPVSTPRFVQMGNVLRLTTVGRENSSPFCLDPVRTAFFDAPPLPAGVYTLEIHYQHPTIEPPLLRLRQSAPLLVSLGTPGSPVPMGGPVAWLALALTLGGMTAWRLRRH